MKDGMPITFFDGRTGWIRDNKKGITRLVEVTVQGQGSDFGSCYIDEIKTVDGERHEIIPAHAKKLKAIKAW
jgi:ribosomal protein L21E